jgi:predicted GNAT family N-acyltransferase
MKPSYYIMLDNALAVVDLTPSPSESGWCTINRINVPHKYRGQGYGRELMRQVLADADAENVHLTLQINPYGEMTFRDLQEWYTRGGFIHACRGFMVRHPNNIHPVDFTE